MKDESNSTPVKIDLIKKQGIAGTTSGTQLSEVSSHPALLNIFDGTDIYNKRNETNIRKSFAERIQKIEDFISATGAYIYYADCEEDYGNYYVGATDTIHLSHPVDFFEPHDVFLIINYYRVLFHELGHWTGHPHRLNRPHNNTIGSVSWAEEELTAELTAAFTLSKLSMTEASVIDQSAYNSTWTSIIEILKDNKISLTSIALNACQVRDYLFSLQNKPPAI